MFCLLLKWVKNAAHWLNWKHAATQQTNLGESENMQAPFPPLLFEKWGEERARELADDVSTFIESKTILLKTLNGHMQLLTLSTWTLVYPSGLFFSASALLSFLDNKWKTNKQTYIVVDLLPVSTPSPMRLLGLHILNHMHTDGDSTLLSSEWLDVCFIVCSCSC